MGRAEQWACRWVWYGSATGLRFEYSFNAEEWSCYFLATCLSQVVQNLGLRYSLGLVIANLGFSIQIGHGSEPQALGRTL